MCGRFTLRASVEAIAEHLGRVLPLAEGPSPAAPAPSQTADSFGPLFAATSSARPTLAARYNIAPTQPVVAVRWFADPRQQPDRQQLAEIFLARWGLRPHWAGEQFMRNPLINARAETVGQKPAFRGAFRHRRCLIPADGFFEWRKEGRKSLPYFIRRHDDGLFFFAGLWEEGSPSDAPAKPTCTILTTEAPDWMQPLHHRMPLILQPIDYASWLSPQSQPEVLHRLLRPAEGIELQYYRVGPAVNSARYDQPDCIAPIEST